MEQYGQYGQMGEHYFDCIRMGQVVHDRTGAVYCTEVVQECTGRAVCCTDG